MTRLKCYNKIPFFSTIDHKISIRSGDALGVVCIDQNIVAVTSVSDKFIQLIYLNIGRPVKFINTNTACSGITLTNGMLVFCSIGKGLRKVYLKDESIVEIVPRSYIVVGCSVK
jgi:hypothetical protein